MDKTVGYVRVSREEQDPSRQTMQLSELKDDNDNQLIPLHLIFIDHGESGAKEPSERPAYKQLLALIDAGEVKTLYVTDLIRLGRDARGTLLELLTLNKKGVVVKSLSSNDALILNADPVLQPLLISAALLGGDYERRKLIDNTKAGIKRAIEKGHKPGRPRIEIDWNKLDDLKKRTGLSEHACVKFMGYNLITFYNRKKEKKSI